MTLVFASNSKLLVVGVLAFAITGCDVIGPETIDEFQNGVFGKQYSTRTAVREISVGGKYYTVHRRDYENFASGSRAKGVDYTVKVDGTVLACNALENSVEECIKDFEKRIPRHSFEVRAREESSM